MYVIKSEVFGIVAVKHVESIGALTKSKALLKES